MTRKMRKCMLAVFCLIACMAFGVFPTKAASGVKVLCKNINHSKTMYADMTGNGKKDTIYLNCISDEYGLYETQVYINGIKALTTKLEDNIDGIVDVSVRYIRMSKNKIFLQILHGAVNDYYGFNAIYRYDKSKKKLIKVLDANKIAIPSPLNEVVKANSKGIQINCFDQPSETGGLKWIFTYTYKNGKLKLKSSTAKAESTLGDSYYDDGYNKYFKKNQFIADRQMKFYTNTNLKKVSFKVKSGDIVTLKKIKMSRKKMYLQFKKGKKTGWIKIGTYGYGCFRGVTMAG